MRTRVQNVCRRWAMAAAVTVLIAGAGGGCSFGNKGEPRAPGSGDPEADQRAEQRVGASSDRGGSTQAKEKTLLERIGGEEGIARLVDDMIPRAVNDPRVNFSRTDVK